MGSNRVLKSLILLVATVHIFSSTWVPADGSPGSDFLDRKEAQVTLLKQAAEENHRRQCELLTGCGAPVNCSRNSCWPLEGDVGHLTCQEVKNNTYCPASTGTCQSKYFDFTRSTVRIAPTTDIAAAITGTTICSQRELDVTFKALCNESSFSRAFFGTVDGIYMHFPGSDQSPGDCGKYDPRLRPWYRTSTSVAKAVMVLVDAGESMGSPLPTPLEGTFLKATQAIVEELLNTMSEQDYVNIITFDSSKATSMAPSPVRVEYYKTGNSTYHPEFDGLKGNLSSIKVENVGQRPSNVSLGITEALKNYAPGGVPGYNTSMKIIVIFTDGNAATLKEGALKELVGKNVKVFIFKLPQPDDIANRFLTGTLFLSQLSSMGGSFNVITSEAMNPLYAIQPYFSYLAKFRTSINDSADYSIIYEDYEHVVDKVFSISRAAFAADGKLLGIVGLNIFMDGLGSNTESVRDALTLRTLGKTFDSTKFILSAENASIQTENNPAQPCGSSIPIPLHGGLCPRTDTVSTIQDLSCCDACSEPGPSPSNSKQKTIIGITVSVGGIFIIVVFVCFVRCLVRRDINEKFIYPGPDKEPVDQPVDQTVAARENDKPACSHFSIGTPPTQPHKSCDC